LEDFPPRVNPSNCCHDENRDQPHPQSRPRSSRTLRFFLLSNDAGLDRMLLNNDPARRMIGITRRSWDDTHPFRRNYRYRRDELIPSPGQRDDVAVVSGFLCQCAAQGRYALGQTVFIHKSVGPDILEQFVPAQNPSRVLDQVQEHVESPAVECDNLIAAPQGARQSIDLEAVPESEYPFCFH